MMKKNFLSIILVTIFFSTAFGQVGINTSEPHLKSALDIVSKNNNTGVLFPRLTTAQINAISPAANDYIVDGLWVYNTDTKCYNYWAASPKNQWMALCGTPITVTTGQATINCAGATTSGTLTANTPASGVTVNVPYSSGNGGSYPAQSISSTGVTGLTASIPAGNFANGSGNLTFIISGTPSAAGTASFSLNMGGTTCTFTVTVNSAGGLATINCAGASTSGTLTANTSASGVTVNVPYSSGNGGSYPAQSISSTGVTGLTASIPAGNFANGSGNLTFTISGTPNSSGTASFSLNMGGTTCTFNVTVNSGGVVINSCSVSTAGNYTVGVPLTSGNRLSVNVNLTGSGPIRLLSEDKNGMLFDSGVINASAGNQVIQMNSVPAASGTFPLTAEESSNGGNGSDNQTGSYTIKNTITNTILNCRATIDVKPRVISVTGMNADENGILTNTANKNGAKDNIVQMFVFSKRRQSIANTFNVMIRNLTSQTLDYEMNSTTQYDPNRYTYTGTISGNGDIGSLDPWSNSTGAPRTDLGFGAFATYGSGLGEMTNVGMNIKYNNKWYKYRFMYDHSTYASSSLNTRIVLYGIYDTKPTMYQTAPPAVLDKDPQSYWP